MLSEVSFTTLRDEDDDGGSGEEEGVGGGMLPTKNDGDGVGGKGAGANDAKKGGKDSSYGDKKEVVLTGEGYEEEGRGRNRNDHSAGEDQVMTVVLPGDNDKKGAEDNIGGSQRDAESSITSHPPSSVSDALDGDVSSSDSAADPATIYVGLVIGVLCVTVLMLLATILVMLRRNKQKVFSKHQDAQLQSDSMLRHLTPMSFVKAAEGGGGAGGPGPINSATIGLHHLDSMTLASSKLYEDAALLNGAGEDIYHEPSYPRLVLQRQQRPSAFR